MSTSARATFRSVQSTFMVVLQQVRNVRPSLRGYGAN
jgi:hypothetical protein